MNLSGVSANRPLIQNPQKKGVPMTYETKKSTVFSVISSLARSNGFYGRLLWELEKSDEESVRGFIDQLPDTTDPVDIILAIES